jgi:hypothetical protein
MCTIAAKYHSDISMICDYNFNALPTHFDDACGQLFPGVPGKC